MFTARDTTMTARAWLIADSTSIRIVSPRAARIWNPKVAADLLRKPVVDLAVARN